MKKLNPIERSQYIDGKYKEYLKSSFEFEGSKVFNLEREVINSLTFPILNVINSLLTKSSIINVKDFGATGDGTTDDTQAIQNALDSVSTGGTIFFPKGIYMLSTCLFNANTSGTSHAIEVYSNQRLLFEEGATLKRGSTAVNHMLFTHNESNATGYTGAENIEIIGATIDGNKSIYNSPQTPINLSHSTNVRIVNCIFKNIGSSWHAIEINSSLDTVVDGCRFEKNLNTEDIQLDVAVSSGNLGSSDGTVCKDTVIKNCVFDITEGVAIGNHTNAAHTNTRI